ncbi:hypothetical protein [Flavobacterium capsici]|uniref:Uncharacterized protein n=1 Tax=Flavobacterium capsici TaxID=3075618 RepID=A0AA96EYN1_9FLAO|nr:MULTISPECIES: hypothetical protein [unclassified Flavobacterium]WNM19270.1 hypothetical protein RN608_00975 [Flavobacterium sp. PMR2A8]WNM20659.1 hypothetical protein RN605_08145 [Flavobacterium sp. PMTSA4]
MPIYQPQRKADIYEALKPISLLEIRAEIIEVIMELRNCPEKQAKDVKTLYPNEVAEVYRRFKMDIDEKKTAS